MYVRNTYRTYIKFRGLIFGFLISKKICWHGSMIGTIVVEYVRY